MGRDLESIDFLLPPGIPLPGFRAKLSFCGDTYRRPCSFVELSVSIDYPAQLDEICCTLLLMIIRKDCCLWLLRLLWSSHMYWGFPEWPLTVRGDRGVLIGTMEDAPQLGQVLLLLGLLILLLLFGR
jgi:hypothetical protein